MSITLLPNDREFTVTVEGVAFHCRRLTQGEEDRLRREHSRRGELNIIAYSRARMRAIVQGWGEGVSEPHSPEAVDRLPMSVRGQLADAHDEGNPTGPPESSSGGG